MGTPDWQKLFGDVVFVNIDVSRHLKCNPREDAKGPLLHGWRICGDKFAWCMVHGDDMFHMIWEGGWE